MVTSYVGTAFYSTLLEERWKGRDDQEENVSSYWIILRKRYDTETAERKHSIALCEELAFAEAVDLLYDRLQACATIRSKFLVNWTTRVLYLNCSSDFPMPHPETPYNHRADAHVITVDQYQAKIGFGKHVLTSFYC